MPAIHSSGVSLDLAGEGVQVLDQGRHDLRQPPRVYRAVAQRRMAISVMVFSSTKSTARPPRRFWSMRC